MIAPVFVPLEKGGSIEILRSDVACQLRIDAPHRAQSLEIEVRFEAQGPVVRVRAPSLVLDAVKNVAVRCETFEVEASEKLSLRSQGDLVQSAERTASVRARDVELDATPGAIRLRANDDVQLLGENVLLNCDRLQPLPEWTQAHLPFPAPSLAPRPYTGDAQLIQSLLEEDRPDTELP